jgi:hypothetical protein
LATQVITRARQILEVDLPLRFLFESPTIAGLAEKVEGLRATNKQQTNVFLEKKARIAAQIDEMSPEEIQDLLKRKEALKPSRTPSGSNFNA